MSAQERQAYYDADDIRHRYPDLVGRMKLARKDIPVPDVKPTIQRLLVSEDGNLWVRPVASELGRAADISEWHVWGPEGAFLAIVEPPKSFEPFFVQGQRAYGVYKDEDGVNYAAIYTM